MPNHDTNFVFADGKYSCFPPKILWYAGYSRVCTRSGRRGAACKGLCCTGQHLNKGVAMNFQDKNWAWTKQESYLHILLFQDTKKWAQNGKEVELAPHTLHFLLQATTMDLELKDLVRARIFCEDIQLSHVVLKAKHNTATNASVPRMVSNRLVDSFLRCRSDLCVQTVGL